MLKNVSDRDPEEELQKEKSQNSEGALLKNPNTHKICVWGNGAT